MRTTITLEDDVAAALARIAKQDGASPKEIINRAVRELVARRARKPKAGAHKTPTFDLGRCLAGSLDDVSEALALAEGHDYP